MGPTAAEDARVALVTLGYAKAVARDAVAAAMARVGDHASLDDVLREALRSCPRAA